LLYGTRIADSLVNCSATLAVFDGVQDNTRGIADSHHFQRCCFDGRFPEEEIARHKEIMGCVVVIQEPDVGIPYTQGSSRRAYLITDRVCGYIPNTARKIGSSPRRFRLSAIKLNQLKQVFS
jgi:hypothetical protein